MLGFRTTVLFLRRNVKRILAASAFVFFLGFFIALLLPNKYLATALVLADPREQKVTAEQDVLPGIGQDSAALQSLVEIATSDGFLRPLIDSLKIASDSEIADGETDPSRLLDNFRKHLDVSRRGLTYVIAISFTSGDPNKAARYANAVADAFSQNQSTVRTGAAVEANTFLTDRLSTLGAALKSSEDAVAAFRAQHNMLDAGKDTTVRQLRLTDLSQQVSISRARVEEARARLDQAQHDLSSNVDAAATSPSRTDLLGLLRAQRAQLADQIAQKKAVFGDRHPDLVISIAQLANLDRQIEVERKRVIDTATSDYNALKAQLAVQEQQLKSAEGDSLSNDEASVKLRELQREADANRNIYEQFLARSKTTTEQQLFQPTQVQVVSPANVPTRPTRRGLAFIAALLALGSLIVGVCIASVQEFVDQRITTAAQIEDELGLPVWSLIADRSRRKKKSKSAPSITMHDDIVPLLQNIFRFSDGSSQVVLVTAMDEDTGKSHVAHALCELAIARGIPSVLLQLDNSSGTTAVRNQVMPQYAVRTNAQTVQRFLSDAGDDLLGLGNIQDDFDLIVVDAPSLSSDRDIAELADACDLTVLVASWEKTTIASIRAAQGILAAGGDASAVAVINGIDAERYALFDPDAGESLARQAA